MYLNIFVIYSFIEMSDSNLNFHSNTFGRATNEQLLLVNILNTMYNDNLRQMNHFNTMMNRLIEDNSQIRQVLVQILGGQPQRTATTTTATRSRRVNLNDDAFTQLINSFMEPIEVFPTPLQIEVATRRATYRDIVRPLNAQCPISMEEFQDDDVVTMIRHCGHIFHSESLTNWFLSSCRCPVCRYDIRDYVPVEPYSTVLFDASFNLLERRDPSTNHVIVPSTTRTSTLTTATDNNVMVEVLLTALNRTRNR